MEHAPRVVYVVDAADRLESVNDAYDDFAKANDGPDCVAARVLSRPLWSFISDPTTVQLYKNILARVRGGRTCRVTLRCDSPGHRRHLELVMKPFDEGAVQFTAKTLAVEDRPPSALFDRARERTAELLRVCGWCARVDAAGEWVQVEEAAAKLGLFEAEALPRLTHGICADCLARVSAS